MIYKNISSTQMLQNHYHLTRESITLLIKVFSSDVTSHMNKNMNTSALLGDHCEM